MLLIGTEKRGKSRMNAGLYYGEISRKGVTTKLGKLSDLKT